MLDRRRCASASPAPRPLSRPRLAAWWGATTLAVNPSGSALRYLQARLAAVRRHAGRLSIWGRRTNMGPRISPARSARWAWWRFARCPEAGG